MSQAIRDQLDELLLADLFSVTEIAERLAIDRKTVRNRRALLLAAGGGDSLCVVAAHETLLATPIRCSGACGGKIYILPCRACKALRLLASERAARQLGLIKPRNDDSPVARKQRELFDEACRPALPAAKKPPPLSTRYSGVIPHFRNSRG